MLFNQQTTWTYQAIWEPENELMSMVWTGSSNLTSIGQLFRMQLAAHFWHTVMQSTLNHWINNQTTINQQSTNIQLYHIIQIIILYIYIYLCTIIIIIFIVILITVLYCHSFATAATRTWRCAPTFPWRSWNAIWWASTSTPRLAACCDVFLDRKKLSNLNSLVYHSWSSNLILTCQL